MLDKEFYTTKEIIKLLGINRQTLHRYTVNIKNRIYSNVLRKSCHQEIEPNKFIPIGIKHEEFKQIYTQMLNDIY